MKLTRKYRLALEIAALYGIQPDAQHDLYTALQDKFTWYVKAQKWLSNDRYLDPNFGELDAYPDTKDGFTQAHARGLYTEYELGQRGRHVDYRAVTRRAVLREDGRSKIYTWPLYAMTETIDNRYQYNSRYADLSKEDYGHLILYKSWDFVPANYKTMTQIRKTDKKRRPNQAPVAMVDTRFETYKGYERGGVYLLYDLNDCLDKTPPTEQQKQAFARVREQSTCTRCGCTGVKLSPEKLCPGCQRVKDDERDFCAMLKRERANAILWAQKLIQTGFVVLDTETTGLDCDAKIVEIAIIDGISGDILVETLINPEIPIPEDASAIHGITDADVIGKPTFQEVQPMLEIALKDKVCVIYNKAYDTPLLKSHGLKTKDFQFDCAMAMYAQFYGQWSDYWHSFRWQSLSNALDQCALEFPGAAHRALGDCQATRNLVHYLAKQPLPEGEPRI